MSSENFIPVGHIVQTVSKIDSFQFFDAKNNFVTFISFRDKKLSQIAGAWGNTSIPSEPIKLEYAAELKWALEQVDGLIKHLNGEANDNRFPNPIVVDV